MIPSKIKVLRGHFCFNFFTFFKLQTLKAILNGQNIIMKLIFKATVCAKIIKMVKNTYGVVL